MRESFVICCSTLYFDEGTGTNRCGACVWMCQIQTNQLGSRAGEYLLHSLRVCLHEHDVISSWMEEGWVVRVNREINKQRMCNLSYHPLHSALHRPLRVCALRAAFVLVCRASAREVRSARAAPDRSGCESGPQMSSSAQRFRYPPVCDVDVHARVDRWTCVGKA